MTLLGLSSLLFIKVLSFYLRLNGNALALLGMSLSNPIIICADRHRSFFFYIIVYFSSSYNISRSSRKVMSIK